MPPFDQLIIGLEQYQTVRSRQEPTAIYSERLDTGHLDTFCVDGWVSNIQYGSYSDAPTQSFIARKKAVERVAGALKWRLHVTNPAASNDVDALTETVEYVYDALEEFGPHAINLRGLNPDAIQVEHLAAVLRATSMSRDETPGWGDALVVAKVALEAAHIEPDEVLLGLI